jgi:hypothetical protein
MIAYNLGNVWRRLALPARIDKWSLTSLQRRYWSLPAESHLTRRSLETRGAGYRHRQTRAAFRNDCCRAHECQSQDRVDNNADPRGPPVDLFRRSAVFC